MSGLLEFDLERGGIPCRNSHDKALAFGIVSGYRTFCGRQPRRVDVMAVRRKHSKSLESRLLDVLTIGVDRVLRQFEPMLARVDAWREHSLSDLEARPQAAVTFSRTSFTARSTSCATATETTSARSY